MISKLFITLAVCAVLTPVVGAQPNTTVTPVQTKITKPNATVAPVQTTTTKHNATAAPKQVTTPKPLLCMTGTCSGIEECINDLNNNTCSGVCTKTVVKKNDTYGDYTLSCNSTYNTCDKFTKAIKATPVPSCCATSFCTKYSPPGNSALNISANFIFLVFASFLKKCLL